jgi:hypothetical protein
VLFQLMMPHDFKDAARQLESIVLVVDDYTANLPWELMFADDPGSAGATLPLALRTPVVRQLAAAQFRRQVRQGFERKAFVVGNPSVEGFAGLSRPAASAGGRPAGSGRGGERGQRGGGGSAGLGYQVVQAIGSDWRATDVLTRLYQQAYRLVHISAHGIFDQPHVDGGRRTGVVLSDGLLITAAEIKAMETVPELVFLSCCHLGKVDTRPAGAVGGAHGARRQPACRQRRARVDQQRCALRRGRRLGRRRPGCDDLRQYVLSQPAARSPAVRRGGLRGQEGGLGKEAGRHHLGRLPGLWRSRLAGRAPPCRQRRPGCGLCVSRRVA